MRWEPFPQESSCTDQEPPGAAAAPAQLSSLEVKASASSKRGCAQRSCSPVPAPRTPGRSVLGAPNARWVPGTSQLTQAEK